MKLAHIAAELVLPASPGAPRRPKYRLLSAAIERDIRTGRLKPGERLPSEEKLADLLPASLGTVQKALTALADQGMVVRKHGLGTFVADRRVEEQHLWHFRFPGDDGALLPVYIHVRTVERASDGPWSAFLGAQPYCIRVCRVVDVNHEFALSSEFVVPGPPFARLLRMRPTRLNGLSIRDLLQERFDVQTVRVRETITCAPLPRDACQVVEVANGTFGLLCEICGFGVNDAPLYYQRVYIPPHARPLEVRETNP